MPLKTIVITGATSGIGKETAIALAKKDYAVYMLVRDLVKGENLRKQIISETKNDNIYVLYCDLANLKTVKAAADTLKQKLFAINVLINNAGGIFAERELSADGFEMTFAINHLGHFLLTMCLMPLLEKGHARIINVSSEAHRVGKPDFNNLRSGKDYSSFKAYGTAKLFNIYFVKSLAERYKSKGITAFALHPGVVDTAFGNGLSGLGNVMMFLARPFMISAKAGAQTTIYLASAPNLDSKSGLYFKKQKVAKPAAIANDQSARDELWDLSSKFISGFLD
jgi:NAD(P)-dependent dehydrogenase (short-subunit alcohol dehydrogenase family)